MQTVKSIHINGPTFLHECSFVTMHEAKDDGTMQLTLHEANGGNNNVEIHIGPKGDGMYCQYAYIMNSAGKTIERLGYGPRKDE